MRILCASGLTEVEHVEGGQAVVVNRISATLGDDHRDNAGFRQDQHNRQRAISGHKDGRNRLH